jgi:predicted DNA-binding antitoxin AbrB/MazE fold protein
MERVIRVIYENGILKPLEQIRLDERETYLVSIYPEEQWQKDFQALLRRTRQQTQKHSSTAIEADITAARAEVKAKRRETGRSH